MSAARLSAMVCLVVLAFQGTSVSSAPQRAQGTEPLRQLTRRANIAAFVP